VQPLPLIGDDSLVALTATALSDIEVLAYAFLGPEIGIGPQDLGERRIEG
jgi:hypothetical protein